MVPYIIAIDFDGTLVGDKFPEIGEPNTLLIELAQIWRHMGAKLVLWTCRHGKVLDEAVAFCKEQGLEFDSVNTNIPEVQMMYGTDTRKVYADIYLDDKMYEFDNISLVEVVKKVATRNNDNKKNT